MAIKINTTNVNSIVYKDGSTNNDVKKVILDGSVAWCKPFTYTTGTLPTGVASLTCTRSAKSEPTAATGTVANNGTIYYEDKLYWTATASTGYNNPTVTYGSSSNTLTVDGNVTGSTYVTAGARISGTYSQGTLPTGVASLTCYRKPWNGSSYTAFTSGTIYYGDSFYWTATASAGYNNPTTTYYDSTHTYTWNGTQGGSLVGVTTSGVQAGSRITWTANVTMGTGIAKYKYSTDGGTNWSSETTATTVANLDYATTLTVKGTTASAGYTVNGNTATATYSSKNVTVPAATRITWSLTVTMSNYVTGWRYKIDSGSWVNKTASYTISGVDYASKVTVEGTSKESAAGYTYGDYSGTGTFGSGSQSTGLSTTLSCTRTRITWNASVSLGTGVAKYKYSTDGGTTWSAETTQASVTGLDYATVLTVKATTASEGYTVTSTTATASYSGQSVTVPACTRIKWSLAVTQGNYIASWTYKINSGSAVTKTSNYTITGLDYADSVVITATNQSEVPYNYGTPTGTGTFTYGSTATTLSSTRTVKSYTLTISVTNSSYGTYAVSRTSSPYQGAATGNLANNSTIYYGDVLSGSSSAKAVDYGSWDITSVTTPTATTTGDATTGNLTITNADANTVTLYYSTTNTTGGISLGSTATGASKTQSNLSFNTTYYFSAARTRSRDKYTYAKDSTNYTGTDSVTANVTATFKFTRTTSTDTGTIYSSVGSKKTAAQNSYAVTITKGTGVSAVYLSTSSTATTGDASGTTYPYGSVVYGFVTLSTGYSPLSGWTLVSGTTYRVGSVNVTSAQSFGIPTPTKTKYTITLSSTYGYWTNSSSTTITSITNVEHGTAASKSGNVLTVGSNTYTFNANTTTAQYSYSDPTIGTVPSTITSNTTISGSATRTLRSYTITFTNPTYGAWGSTTKTAYYGDTLSVSGYTVTCKEGSTTTNRWTNTCSPNAQTDQYTYALSGTITVASPVTGAQTVAAPSSSRTERSYDVTFTNGSYGTWNSTTKITATYSTAISLSGKTVTVGTSTRTYSLPDNTAQYTYGTTINNASGTVGTGKSITTTDTRTVNKYAVSITAGTGLSSAYLSTSSTATSGSASGTQYDYGTTVYAFVVLAEHYDVPADSNWVLVSGTMHETGSKYRVGSVTVSAAHNFGTFVAVIEKYNLSIIKGNGISTIYYKVNGASSYASTTSNLSVAVNDLSTYYYYATATDYYTANADCGTSSSPKSGTVNCADISASVTATAKTYKLVGTYTNGTVTWYSNSSRTTVITQAAYGSTVYYAYSANTGYSGSGNGSLVLNTTNFTFASTAAGSNATHSFGSATRLTWSLSITKSNYMSTVQYSIDGGTAVTVTGTTNLTGIDYASSVVVSGTKQSEAPYDYGAITGAGTFTYSATAQATTVACTRSVKEYTLTISTTNPSYGTYSVSRTSSPYKGASTGTLSNGAKIYYGDVLTGTSSGNGTSYGSWNITSVTAPTYTTTGSATSGNLTVTNADSHTATLYYNTTSSTGGTSLGSTASGSSKTATGLSFNTTYYISARVSRSRDKYVDATDGTQYSGTNGVTANVTATFAFKRTTSTDTGTIDSSVVSAKTAAQTTYTITFTRKSQPSSAIQTLGTAVNDTSIGVASVTVGWGGSYSETFSKTNYISKTKSGSNVKANATVAVTLVPDTVNITQTDIANASETLNYAWAYKDASYTVTQTVTPSQGYDYTTGGTRYYNGNSYTRSITTPATTSFGSLTMNKFNYTVSGGSATNGTVAWTNGTYGSNSTWTISPNYGYNAPSTATGTKTINTTNFTVSDANKTAVYSGSLGTCTAQSFSVTINRNYYAITGVNSKATSTTADTATSITVTYNTNYTYTYSKTGYTSQTFSGKWTNADNKPAITQTLTLQPTQYTLSWSGSNWSGGWYTSTAYSSAITYRYYGYAAYFRATPNSRYEATVSSTRYYNGQYYTTNVATTSTTNGSVALTAATAITYTVSGGTAGHGTVAWTNGTYGTNSTWTITANTGYTRPTTYTGTKAINTTNFTVSDANKTATYSGNLGNCTANKYTLTINRNYYAITGAQTKASTTTADTATSIEVTYDSAYSYTYSKTGYDSQTASGTWTTAGDGSTTLTLNPHQYTVSQAAISNASESVNYAWVYYNQSATQTVTPDVGYDYTASSIRYYNGKSYTRSSGAVTANYTFATLTMNKFTYTVSGGSSSNGTVAWTGGNQIGGSATWTITANTGYTRPTNYTGSATINSTNFTLSEANKTAVYKSSFDPCTINSYTVTFTNNGYGGTWKKGSTTVTTATYNYGTSISISSNTVTINTDIYTYTAPSDTAEWDYTFTDITKSTASVTEPVTITGNVSSEKRQYVLMYNYYINYSTPTIEYVYFQYGDDPSTATPISGTVPTPQTVTYGDNKKRRYYNGWNNLPQVVTSDTGVLASYTHQVNVTSLTQTYADAYSDDSRTTPFTTGWKDDNTTIYWKGKTNYYYSSTSQNGTSTVVGGTNTYNPTYQKCHITSVRCGEGDPDGYYILAIGININWLADDGYAFDDSGNTLHTEKVTLGDLEYTASADYKYIRVNTTNATADVSTGYRHLGDYITWTPTTAGSNTKYSCTNTIAVNPTDAQRKYTEQIIESKATYGNSSYTYYYVQLDDHPYVDSIMVDTTVIPSGNSVYVLNGKTVIFTATTATGSTRYSFSYSSSTVYTSQHTITSADAGETVYSGDIYVWYYNKVTTKDCSLTPSTYKNWDWRLDGSSCTATVYYGAWSFTEGTTGVGTKTFDLNTYGDIYVGPEYVMTYFYLTNCTCDKKPSTQVWIYLKEDSYVTIIANSNYSFNTSGTTQKTIQIVQGYSSCGDPEGMTISESPGYAKLTITRSNCTAQSGSATAGWKSIGSYSVKSQANSGYTFGSASSVNRVATQTNNVTVPNSVTHTAVKWEPRLLAPQLYFDSSDGSWKITNPNPITVHVEGTWDWGDQAFSYSLGSNGYQWWFPNETGEIKIRFTADGYIYSEVEQYVHKATT